MVLESNYEIVIARVGGGQSSVEREEQRNILCGTARPWINGGSSNWSTTAPLANNETHLQQQQREMAPDIADPVVPVVGNDTADGCHEATDAAIRQRVPSPGATNTSTSSSDDLVKMDNNNNQIGISKPANTESENFRPQIRWPDLIAQVFLHAGFVIGLWELITLHTKFYTVIWTLLLIWGSGFGITAGAHRLWSHKSYKAKWPLRLLLMFLFTICGQRDAYTWAHDHRVHHKYSETDADPHNSNRGFFFSHVGWVFLTPHPEVVAKRKIIDMSDLEADAIVMWQRKYYLPLFALLVIGFPVLVPYHFWNESLWVSFWVCFTLRFTTTLNIAFFVNSVAHMYGNRPYDKNISPVENLSVAIAAMGEGWHNYHHVFPWDYKTGELGSYMFNVTTGFIDGFARIGWAYDRKSVSPEIIERRAAKYGDGTRFLTDDYAHKDAVWGFGDKDIAGDDLEDILRRQE